MIKIFDETVIKYMKECGVSDREIQKIQFKELKKHTLSKLVDIVKLIEADKYKSVLKQLNFSPAGDGYGCDNNYITFNNIIDKGNHDGVDIGVVLEKLTKLKKEIENVYKVNLTVHQCGIL